MTQTDSLLAKLYHQLQNSGDTFSLTYFSDHGLAFKERGKEVQYLAHDDKFQQNFRCRLWCYPAMTKRIK